MIVETTVNKGATGSLVNKATVSGGGAPSVSTQATNQISSTPAPFGMSGFDFFVASPGGTQETQAGAHPYELTTTINLNTDIRLEQRGDVGLSDVASLKDVVVDLPLGFAGSTLAAPQCTEAQMVSEARCPPDTIVGYLRTEPDEVEGIDSPIWNLVPSPGHPAEFGYIDLIKGAHVLYVNIVPTAKGYVLQTTSSEVAEVDLQQIIVTFYGNPALRDDTGEAQVPFFTNPTACSDGPQVASIWVDSWQHPGSFNVNGTPDLEGDPNWVKATSEAPAVTGCNALSFAPQLGSQPTTHEADKPSGLEFEQRLPQSEVVGTDATPALKNTVITFPEGMTVDPSSADGLGTCSNGQIGWEGPTLFDFSPAKPECPESSKIGAVELETPLISGKLYGEVFLAAQNENPFHSTFAIYIVVNDPTTGVVLKLAGELKSNPSTGQLTAAFDETPQLPFSNLKVHFFGGPRAELATPPNCGIYQTNSELTPWSAPDSGLPATPFDDYTIDENCAVGFNPAFTGGSTNLQAGGYTTFQASFERQDDDQELGGAEVSLPPGLLADVPSVTECGEAELKAEEAEAPGGCPESSQVGTVEAGAGPGPNPLFVPGKVFWTGPHNGGPFGLAVVVSANPGPFHFGKIVVRQSIRINPLTAAVTDVSDPFPTYLDPRGPNGQVTGIPIKLRRVDIEINRPGFAFNPTDCAKEKFLVGGAITSVEGARKTLATPFQVTNCAKLAFKPVFKVSTSAHTSRLEGASLHVSLTLPGGAEANVGKVKVSLPKQLPSPLKTLQKACTEKVFAENPANCPVSSKVGEARVDTPVLTGPLTGPAYFVSHGGAKYPELVMVLTGENGVTAQVHGETFISKAGITTATFATVPDVPFSSFELTLPEREYPALTADGNLCKGTLSMPTEMVGQNGLVVDQDTKIAVTGCPKARKAKHRKGGHRKKATKGRRKKR